MERIIKENNLDLSLEDNIWEIPTRIELVNTIDTALERKLTRLGWKLSEIRDFVKYVFHELLINAIAHGNLGIDGGTPHIYEAALEEQAKQKTDKKVFIKIDADPNKITITIQDQGGGFTIENVDDPTKKENLRKTMGRGELFMKTFATSIKHKNLEPEGHEVKITKERE